MNAWLVRAATAAVQPADQPRTSRSAARRPALHRLGPLTPSRLGRTTVMPAFDTPGTDHRDPELIVGDVRVTATDRTGHRRRGPPHRPGARGRRPGRRARPASSTRRQAARQDARSACAMLGPFAKDGLGRHRARPAHRLRTCTPTPRSSAFHCTGALGDCRIRTATGDLNIERAATLDATTGGRHHRRGERRRRRQGHHRHRDGRASATSAASVTIKNSNGRQPGRHRRRRRGSSPPTATSSSSTRAAGSTRPPPPAASGFSTCGAARSTCVPRPVSWRSASPPAPPCTWT